jgi:hypothetical protein
VELQYRGVMWLHVNGKEWTPYAFLVSKRGGPGLDVAKDQATLDALAGALPILMAESISQLRSRRLDAEFFNGVVSPDAIGLMLRWLSNPETFKQRRFAGDRPAGSHRPQLPRQETRRAITSAAGGPLKKNLFSERDPAGASSTDASP